MTRGSFDLRPPKMSDFVSLNVVVDPASFCNFLQRVLVLVKFAYTSETVAILGFALCLCT